MKNIFALVCIALLFGCKSTIKKDSETLQITSNQLKEIVSYLASDELQGRLAGSVGIDKAATYIENQFKSYGVNPYFDSYRDNFKIQDSINAFNVVGYIEGSDSKLKEEVIIIGAHYDHIGFGQNIKKYGGRLVKKDSISNGANDNATGVSAVLTLANYFATKKSNKRSIIFALFSAEEWGLFGSKHLSEKLKAKQVNLYTMVNFEMIGVPLKGRDYLAFVSGYDLSNMASKLNEYNGSKFIGFSEVSKKYNLFKQSDNYPFYEQFKTPCQTISSCDLSNYDYYHHVDDETELMDYEFMANLMNNTSLAIEKMTNTPTREIVMKPNKNHE
ncbi:M28 family peptidase [Ichthyenterobacterium magnum]|uniref:Peptidase M28-like protein n=1 Tax=Ichthyenterobacterium magnum TaxID=1230530 RepID=A0A420DFN9_9FLAO|nr:M28 family peptidase [Ichthyenterobacterium magnum]RKE91006.1 peptidase M28-like protein [Ichthyenterobacterium magnum]